MGKIVTCVWSPGRLGDVEGGDVAEPPIRFGRLGVPFAPRLPFRTLSSPQRELPTETKVESGTSHCKSGTSVNLSNRGFPGRLGDLEGGDVAEPPSRFGRLGVPGLRG